jgi:hypothetical protein
MTDQQLKTVVELSVKWSLILLIIFGTFGAIEVCRIIFWSTR